MPLLGVSWGAPPHTTLGTGSRSPEAAPVATTEGMSFIEHSWLAQGAIFRATIWRCVYFIVHESLHTRLTGAILLRYYTKARETSLAAILDPHLSLHVLAEPICEACKTAAVTAQLQSHTALPASSATATANQTSLDSELVCALSLAGLQNLARVPETLDKVLQHLSTEPHRPVTQQPWSSPPAVDPPVSKLSKTTTIPVVDAASFNDPIDKRLEGFCKSIFTAAGRTLRPIIATPWVSRSMEVWVEQVAQLMAQKTPPHTSF
ncbi:unnamed protein product [Protopolystoma xenopodis]|uniref:Uncharacterized protein n=1 Tax=Protopolystoma xenopodis TaxID=117903 RepID=A0A3S5AD64_9PLAT|nr:unnamed protein product [Protopolystoma xenopodis]